MSFLNGLGGGSLLTQFSFDRDSRDMREIQASLTSGLAGNYAMSSRTKASKANIEVQSEDNTTFLFEYRAFLNSQLTTLVTRMTNALTSDLDAVMAEGRFGKPSMQGRTSNVQIDPGAGRVAWAYLGTWRGGVGGPETLTSVTPASGTNYTDQAEFPAISAPSGGYTRVFQNGTGNNAEGTIAVMNYGNTASTITSEPDDTLFVSYSQAHLNKFAQSKKYQINITDDAAKSPYLAADFGAGNKLEEVLHKEARTAVFRNILRAGLFKDLVVSASSSLATGSQIQASISFNARFAAPTSYTAPSITGAGAEFNAAIDMFLNRFTSFYHT